MKKFVKGVHKDTGYTMLIATDAIATVIIEDEESIIVEWKNTNYAVKLSSLEDFLDG